jgi:cytochrome d ubiquinol oxidase subunit I
VGRGLHFLATCIVALGTLASAFWIISANSWMQHPAGFVIDGRGRFVVVDWWKAIFSETMPLRLAHMVLAAYLSTALVVGAASAFMLLKRKGHAESRIALRMAVGMALVVAPLQLLVGDAAGKQVGELQPSKLAAIEAFWDTKGDQPFDVVAWPDRAIQGDHFHVQIPEFGSLITHGRADAVVHGLKELGGPKNEPPVFVVFWAFRVMVGLGVLMILQGLWGAFLWLRGRLDQTRLYLRFATLMGPAGFIAVIAGWTTAEVGRQPWVIYGWLRTSDAVAPVGPAQVSISLLAFLIVYAIVFCVGLLYILRLMAEGPSPVALKPPPPDRAPGSPLAAAPEGDAP